MVKESLNDSYCDISGNVGDLSLLGELDRLLVILTTNNCVQGEMGGIKLYFSKGTVARALREDPRLTELSLDVLNPTELLKTKQDSIARFIHVIIPILELYQLPATTVHIFCDLAGSTIAFNRNASIFLNLRYYEAWRMCKIPFLCHLRLPKIKQTTTWLRTEISPKLTRHGNQSPLARRFRSIILVEPTRYFTLAHEIAHNLVQPHNSEHEFYFSSICQKFLPGLSKLTLAKK